MYREISQAIQVEAIPQFVPERSEPEKPLYFFAYHIRISNLSDAPVQLLSRHWIITDGKGEVHEVKGDGVIGLQPIIPPGEIFEYASFCPLPTPTGNMRGSYIFKTKDGSLKAKIPLFFLRRSNESNPIQNEPPKQLH